MLDADTFRTRVNNFFDHDVIGESNLFFPLTIDKALIRGWELTLRSPRLLHRAQMHLAYSNQIVEAGGGNTGGLTHLTPKNFDPPPPRRLFAPPPPHTNTLHPPAHT